MMLADELDGVADMDFPTPLDIARLVDPHTVQTPALDIIDAALMAAVDGTGPKRLIISMPPQEGKSQRVSRFFPTWLLKRNPSLRLALIGYQDAISRRWGGAIRDDIRNHYAQLKMTVRGDSSAKNEWKLVGSEGGVITSSIAGSLTGRPVDVMIIDDPHKDAKEADSELMRENIKEWWRTAASTRMPAGGGIVIVVQTRWHEDDLAGFLLGPDNPGRDEWHLINIPARAAHDPAKGSNCKCGQVMGRTGVEMACIGYDILNRAPGEYMISARGRSVRDWQQRERDAGSRGWSALFQGWPSPSEGSILKRHWWQYYSAPRAVEQRDGSWHAIGANQVIMSIDCAFKDTEGSDYVVMGVLARRGAEVWLLDVDRDKMDFEETCRRLEAMSAKWPQAALKIVEDKANGPAVIKVMRKKVGGIVPYTPVDSKEARARAVSPFVEAGNVLLPAPSLAPWVGGFVHECATFPNGANDDQVDMLTQALIRLLLDGGGGGDYLAEMEAEQRRPSGDGALNTDASQWATADHEFDDDASPVPAFAR